MVSAWVNNIIIQIDLNLMGLTSSRDVTGVQEVVTLLCFTRLTHTEPFGVTSRKVTQDQRTKRPLKISLWETEEIIYRISEYFQEITSGDLIIFET